jgi:hypothetical protein
MRALVLLAACSTATITPPRAPSPGVPPYAHPTYWRTPAVLCVNGTKLVGCK